METVIYLDTHVVVWMYAGAVDLLSRKAKIAIETSDLLVSPMVALELEFLGEIGRIRADAGVILETLNAQVGLRVCDFGFPDVIRSAQPLAWTRDPFDRVIVGQALATGRQLVTKDKTIRRRVRSAIW